MGTVFENSNLPLTKWFLAISIILSAKKGVSSLQLSRDISVNKNTAWLLQFKIRKAMKENAILSGIVEADETYIGGASYNKHHYKRQKFKKGIVTGMTNKKPVLGMVERSGKVVAYAIEKAWGEEIMPILKNSINVRSTVVTDGFGGYYQVKNCFDQHQILKHEQNQFKRVDFHTNTIEGFWSILKRAIIGQYHKISEFHLQGYIDEVSFKYNYRKNEDRGFKELLVRLLDSEIAKP